MRFVETVDNKEYEAIHNGTLKYNIKRESFQDKYKSYCDKWVARDTDGNMVDEPHRYRNDLFEILELSA